MAAKKTPKKAPRKGLHGMERAEAVLWAQERLVEGMPDREVRAKLRTRYKAGESAARGMLKDAVQGLREQVAEAIPGRRELQLAKLDHLYHQAAKAKDFGAAKQVAALLARIEGHERPAKHHHRVESPATTAPVAASQTETDFSTRSDADLHYFVERGHWPEEAPEEDEFDPGPPGAGVVVPEAVQGGDDFPLG
jgi:hypothetical protein